MVLALLLRAAVHAAGAAARESARGDSRLGTIHHENNRAVGSSTYSGSWKVGTGPHGNGVMTFATGAKYEGQWVNCKPHGRGTYHYKSGDKYTGDFSFGKRFGTGTFVYANGNVYVGGWSADKKNGPGTFYKGGRMQFNGYYRNNLRHGPGHEFMANGDRFEGNFVNGMRSGEGRIVFANGDIYEGKFRNGARLDGRYLFATQAAAGAPQAEQQIAAGTADSEEPTEESTEASAPDAEAAAEVVAPEVAMADQPPEIVNVARVLACFPWAFPAGVAETAVAAAVFGGTEDPADAAREAIATLLRSGAVVEEEPTRLSMSYAMQVYLQDDAFDVAAAEAQLSRALTAELIRLANITVGSTAAQEEAWAALLRDRDSFYWALDKLVDASVTEFAAAVRACRTVMGIFVVSKVVALCRRALVALGIEDPSTATPATDAKVTDGEFPYNAQAAAVLGTLGVRLYLLEKPEEAEAASSACCAFIATCTSDNIEIVKAKFRARAYHANLRVDAVSLQALSAEMTGPEHFLERLMVDIYQLSAHFKARDYIKATEVGENVLARSRASGNLYCIVRATSLLAFCRSIGAKARITEARALADEAVELGVRVGVKELLLMGMLASATICAKEKDTTTRYGIAIFEQIMAMAKEQEILVFLGSTMTLISSSLTAIGETSQAAALVAESLATTPPSDGRKLSTRRLLYYGLLIKLNRFDEALVQAKGSLEACRSFWKKTVGDVPYSEYNAGRVTMETRGLLAVVNSLNCLNRADEAFPFLQEYVAVAQMKGAMPTAAPPVAAAAAPPAAPAAPVAAAAPAVASVTETLKQLRLSDFEAALTELGVESVDDMADVGEEDLVGLGMTKIQRNRFLKHVAGPASVAAVPVAGAGAGSGAGSAATLAVPAVEFKPRVIFFTIGLKVVKKATGCDLGARVAVLDAMLATTIKIRYMATSVNCALTFGNLVLDINPRHALQLYQTGASQAAQITKMSAATKKIVAEVNSQMKVAEGKLGPYLKPEMEPDSARPGCKGCSKEFGMFRRRHHCRACGGLCCDDCTKRRVILPLAYGAGEGPVRLCQACAAQLGVP